MTRRRWRMHWSVSPPARRRARIRSRARRRRTCSSSTRSRRARWQRSSPRTRPWKSASGACWIWRHGSTARASRAGREPQARGNDYERDSIARRELLAEEDRGEQKTERRREEEVCADPARFAVLQDPEPQHRCADAHDHDEVGEAPQDRRRPDQVRGAFQRKRGRHQHDAGAEQLSAVQHQRVRPLGHAFEKDVREHERDDAGDRQQDVLDSGGLRTGASVHGQDDTAESEHQTDEFAGRERLAQQPRRKQREDERIGAGDDRAHPRREMLQRKVVQTEVERVASQTEREEPQPRPAVARDWQAQRGGDDEKDGAGDGEADRQDPERRRVASENAARHERGRPKEYVENRSAGSESPGGGERSAAFLGGRFGHRSHTMPPPLYRRIVLRSPLTREEAKMMRMIPTLCIAVTIGCGVSKDEFAAQQRDAQQNLTKYEQETEKAAALEKKLADVQQHNAVLQ